MFAGTYLEPEANHNEKKSVTTKKNLTKTKRGLFTASIQTFQILTYLEQSGSRHEAKHILTRRVVRILLNSYDGVFYKTS